MDKGLILITGATGHLGFRTLVLLLQHGYRARVSHRRPDQVEMLKQTASLRPFTSSIEFTLVPDITAHDAYDEAVLNVDGIVHVASPVHMGFGPEDTDWKKLLYEPAERGTLAILTAAAKEQSVKRVVITSSNVVLEPKNGSDRAGPYDLRELPAPAAMENASTAEQAYVLSKVLSHVTATHFAEEHRSFDLVRILPGYIQGANELCASAEDLRNPKKNGSNEGVMTTALGTRVGHARITTQALLEDVAVAHVLALQPQIANHGDCLLACGNGGDSIPWADFVPIIREQFPEAVEEGILDPAAEDENVLIYFDVSASEKALGFKFAGPKEMVKSVVGQYTSLTKSL